MSKKTQEMIAEELETLLLDAFDIEEEEEEEEYDDDDEFDPEEDEDRGDEVDPDLPDDDDDLPGEDADGDADGDADADAHADADDFDADDLADLAGEGGDKKPSMIPHARFNEINEALKKERAERLQLEEELARTRGRVPKDADAQQDKDEEPPAFDFKAKRKELRDALYEGNEERAEQLEDEIEAAKAAEFERRAEAKAQQLFESRQAEAEAKRIQTEVQAAATAAMTKYTLLNPEVEGHDPELLEEVVALRNFYIHQKGMSPGEAITKAADKVAGRGAASKDDAGDSDAKPAGKKLKPDAKPTTEQLRRNDERSRKIPPRDGGLGERASDIDWENLTEEEFENLPESVKRKERGDFVS
jgi:hypothetical protein